MEVNKILNKYIKLVSIIVTYNGSFYIESCIESLMNSNLSTDIIVIDNNSTDETVNIIESKYTNIKLIKSNINVGFGKANNIGLSLVLDSDADYVFLLNQDARVEFKTLSRLVLQHMENTDFGVLSPIHLDGSGKLLDIPFLSYLISSKIGGIELISENLIGKNSNLLYPIDFVNASAWLISRNCLNLVGGFDPLFIHYAEDNNYLDRVHYHGLKVGIVSNSRMYHDRKNRNDTNWENPFHHNFNSFKRTLLLNSLNPFNPVDIHDVLKHLRRRLLKSIFTFNLQSILFEIDMLNWFLKKNNSIKKHLQLSKIKGTTFLEKR
ncbi:glycosyltransferase family 2 protein [uncultured Cyclobacterium sp.]|uniref:glycosyltransferase family 2 protein n=1 Tax=uncultured Cyclobacterium sp. TaxID=453820 RepID=UPI0030EF43D1